MKLTLENWKEILFHDTFEDFDDINNMDVVDMSEHTWVKEDFNKRVEQLLKLQQQADIEWFKNMESMKKRSLLKLIQYTFNTADCCSRTEIEAENQKIEEILNELKVK